MLTRIFLSEKILVSLLNRKKDYKNLEKSLQLIKENNPNLKPTKIIAILKDDIWNLTLMDNMLGIIRIKINAISEKLLDFNKGSLMEFASAFHK